jgi:hypothetical protein
MHVSQRHQQQRDAGEEYAGVGGKRKPMFMKWWLV